MYCAPCCKLAISKPLRLLNCELITQPAHRCRLINPHWQSAERSWILHNVVVLRQLAEEVDKPLESVGIYMSKLTLKKFGEIMNPKCSGWCLCRVPFVRPETCMFYDGIFNVFGNLRNPLHPLIFEILSIILSHFLNYPCAIQNWRPHTIDDVIFRRYEEHCLFGDGLKGLGDKIAKFMDDMRKKLASDEDKEDADGDDDADKLDHDIKKRKMGEEEEEEEKRPTSVIKRKTTIVEAKRESSIATLYEQVVQNKHHRKVVHVKKKSPPPAPPTPPPEVVKQAKGPKRDPRIMGNIIPVLVHEPFSNQKPWTWVRRHPVQTRVMEGQRLGRGKVRRYLRETVQMEHDAAKKKYSIRSVYSTSGHKSVVSVNMFGKKTTKSKRDKEAPLLKAYDYKSLKQPAVADDGKKKGQAKAKPTAK